MKIFLYMKIHDKQKKLKIKMFKSELIELNFVICLKYQKSEF